MAIAAVTRRSALGAEILSRNAARDSHLRVSVNGGMMARHQSGIMVWYGGGKISRIRASAIYRFAMAYTALICIAYRAHQSGAATKYLAKGRRNIRKATKSMKIASVK